MPSVMRYEVPAADSTRTAPASTAKAAAGAREAAAQARRSSASCRISRARRRSRRGPPASAAARRTPTALRRWRARRIIGAGRGRAPPKRNVRRTTCAIRPARAPARRARVTPIARASACKGDVRKSRGCVSCTDPLRRSSSGAPPASSLIPRRATTPSPGAGRLGKTSRAGRPWAARCYPFSAPRMTIVTSRSLILESSSRTAPSSGSVVSRSVTRSRNCCLALSKPGTCWSCSAQVTSS